MIEVRQIKVPVAADDESSLRIALEKKIKTKEYTFHKIIKKSIDARDKDHLLYIYSVLISLKNDQEEKRLIRKNNNNNFMLTSDIVYQIEVPKTGVLKHRPIIVGFGPAGLFCAYLLAKHGYQPIVIERGREIAQRKKDVDAFFDDGKLNVESNVQFGEGGAGTFSDGKLNTQVKDKYGRIKYVLNTFVEHGAKDSITYDQKPHIGTDCLCDIIVSMRNEIISLGGCIYFEHQLLDINEKDNNLYELTILNKKENKNIILSSSNIVLALGHSARDTFAMLHDKNLAMEPKPFAIGLRIEHPASMIKEGLYGKSKEADLLPPASYNLRHKASNGRNVYSFCMCPGGYVVNASSNHNESVVNGMSYSKRDGKNSNSAIVVNVTPEDFLSTDTLAGIAFQEKYEKLAYEVGKGNIPLQLFKDFKNKKISESFGEFDTNLKGKYTFSDLNECLPEYVVHAIINGVLAFEKQIPGFSRDDAILTGIESRTSSPIKMIRNEDFESISFKNIYPCGEGAGYAGGITSAAVDGLKVAEAIIKKGKPDYQ